VLLPEDPGEEELARNWTLSEADKREATQCRGDENRRRFALQLCVLRRHGRLLEGGETAPARIVNHLGAQLELPPVLFAAVALRPVTEKQYADRVRRYLGWRGFDAQIQHELAVWAEQRTLEGFSQAEVALRAEQLLLGWHVVLPRAAAFARLLQSLCRRAERQVFARIAEQLPPGFRKEIDRMLEVPESAHRSDLFHLKTYPPEGKPDTILSFLANYHYLHSIGVAEIRLVGCTVALLLQFAKTARREDVWHLRRLPEAKRYALTACFLVEAMKITLDHAVEMNDQFRSYVYPVMDCPNLTVLSQALVLRVVFENKRAVAIDVSYGGEVRRIRASLETILSLGAINTPTLLMQSGVGDEAELTQFGIPVVQHLPGVGKNFQDHVLVSSVWEYKEPLAPRNNGGEATVFWKSESGLNTPDIQVLQAEFPLFTAENAHYGPPPGSWSICACLVRPGSHGQIRLTGPNPLDPVQIEANTLDDPADLKALVKAVELCREIGNSQALRPFAKREVMPGPLRGAEIENFIGNGAATVWHQTCTAKMGRDAMSVVDHELKVYGVENLRVADGSIMPRVTTGNTMAPCIVIGERAADVLCSQHKLATSAKLEPALG